MIMKTKPIDATNMIMKEKQIDTQGYTPLIVCKILRVNTSMDWQVHAVQWSQNWSPDLT
jgi:hypothetical protein